MRSVGICHIYNDNGKLCLGVISLDELNKGVFEPKELRCFDDEE